LNSEAVGSGVRFFGNGWSKPVTKAVLFGDWRVPSGPPLRSSFPRRCRLNTPSIRLADQIVASQ